MIKAVILDLDDTLSLTEATCFELENAALKTIRRAPMPRQVHLKTWGQPLFEAISERSPGVDVAAFKLAYQPVIEHYIEVGRLDAIPQQNIQALDELIASGKALYILTSRTRTELAHLMDTSHLLSGRIQQFYYRDTMKFHKPDPRAFAQLLHDHAYMPEECVYVGDSITDAAAAHGAELYFIACLESGLRTRTDFDPLTVDAFIQTFPEVVEAVATLGAA
jgi:phosphoglycolate phosphatase